MKVPLPDSFPEGTKFFNFYGIPVTITAEGVFTRYDGVLYQDPSQVWLNGSTIDEAEFRSMVSKSTKLDWVDRVLEMEANFTDAEREMARAFGF